MMMMMLLLLMMMVMRPNLLTLIVALRRDGSMARGAACRRFAHAHGLQWLTIRDLVQYQKSRLPQVS